MQSHPRSLEPTTDKENGNPFLEKGGEFHFPSAGTKERPDDDVPPSNHSLEEPFLAFTKPRTAHWRNAIGALSREFPLLLLALNLHLFDSTGWRRKLSIHFFFSSIHQSGLFARKDHLSFSPLGLARQYDIKRFSTFCRIGYRSLSCLRSRTTERRFWIFNKIRLPVSWWLGRGKPLNPYLTGLLVHILRDNLKPKD